MTYSILFTTKKLQTVLIEMGVLSLLFAFLLPRFGSGFFRMVEGLGHGLAHNKKRAILFSIAFPMAARALMLPFFPIPKPVIHDEFSYLLQGDTFAHGRVSNPVPVSPEHFESEYVLLNPTYASQYQPLPGVFLALGQITLGHPWFGVWIATGLMCGAICWALMEILPPTWGLFGAVLAALQFGIFGFWMNSYFGGSVPAIGGALIFGGLARMRRHPKDKLVSSGIFCALGIVVLMASRPFEGILWSAIALVVAARVLLKAHVPAQTFGRSLAVTCALLFVGASSLAVYNAKVTGDPLTPPYLKYRLTYGTPQSYWWQPPILVSHFANVQLRENFEDQYEKWKQRDSAPAVLESTRVRLRDFWRFFVGPLVTPALLFLGLVAVNDRRIRWTLFASIPFIIDHATYHAWYPQQSAPATILIVLLLVQCWRHLRVWMRRRGFGLAMSRNLVATMAMAVFLAGVGRAMEPVFPRLPRKMAGWPRIWETLYQPKRLRDDVTARLEQIPGKHLLLIMYSPGHCFCEEWVFNSANLEDQRIIYARASTPESDLELARKFKDHDVWVIEPDLHPYLLARIGSSSQLAQLYEGAALGETGATIGGGE